VSRKILRANPLGYRRIIQTPEKFADIKKRDDFAIAADRSPDFRSALRAFRKAGFTDSSDNPPNAL
jgi:hypothetical protein